MGRAHLPEAAQAEGPHGQREGARGQSRWHSGSHPLIEASDKVE